MFEAILTTEARRHGEDSEIPSSARDHSSNESFGAYLFLFLRPEGMGCDRVPSLRSGFQKRHALHSLVKKNVANGIKSFFLDGPTGRLEALLNEGLPDATHAALVCHPHPLFGGTMHNKVVYHAMKTLSGFGFPVLRFNFRGAGLSEGEHDKGQGEQDDVRAALHWLESELQLPILFCGFSFGAATGLRAACADKRVAGLISLGTPVGVEGRAYTYLFLKDCIRPTLSVSGSRDQYG